MKVVVVGAGASGLMAAHFAKLGGNEVTVIERNARPARKVMITGKGRCNVTNNCDIGTVIENIPNNSKFMYSALRGFTTQDTIEYFEALGVELKTERGNRVFPKSDKAVDIVDALYNGCKGCKFLFNTKVEALITENDRIKGVMLEDSKSVCADAVIVATGGMSYHLTGSTGDGYAFAKSAGHSVTKLKPSLIPLETEGNLCEELKGLSLKNVGVKVLSDNGRVIYEDFGEMIFTHFGVSGPIILSASAHIDKPENCVLSIDMKPALSMEQLNARIQRDLDKYSNKDFINSLSELMPKRLIPVMLNYCGLNGRLSSNQISKLMRAELANALKNFKLKITGFRPIDEAIITRGGVNVKELEPRSMESKICSGLYFVGEVIDVDAYTGGFNLQIAFSTGAAAGKAI